jgi:hypothetical protein
LAGRAGIEKFNFFERNMHLRPIDERDLDIGDGVRAAIELIKKDYGAVLTHDSGHTKVGPTWIFTFPKHSNAQLAVRMNKEKVTMYMRSKALSGQSMLDLAVDFYILQKTYPLPDGHPAQSLRNPEHAPFLNPTRDVPLLLIQPNVGSLKEILDLYLAVPVGGVVTTEGASPSNEAPDSESEPSRRKPPAMTEQHLLDQLDRNALTGKAGELLVVLDELKRLRDCECSEPEKFVKLISIDDVGRGFDIASTWPGEERFIEVKSTTVARSDFFITENECIMLSALGNEAWLYRVFVNADGSGEITSRLQNPIERIAFEHKTPAVWRVKGKALES